MTQLNIKTLIENLDIIRKMVKLLITIVENKNQLSKYKYSLVNFLQNLENNWFILMI